MKALHSFFADDMSAMLLYRAALGQSNSAYEPILFRFDNYCTAYFSDEKQLTKEIILSWLEHEETNLAVKATVIRTLGKYMVAIGRDAYVLYDKYAGEKSTFRPYLFTDEELKRLFSAIDCIKPAKDEPFLPEIAPVLYRLIYTCGLRPNEGRELQCEHINFKTGEILVTHTKGKKERTVVMSKDMLKLCRSYRKRRDIFAGDSEWFFPSWRGGALSSYQIGHYFRRCFKASCADVASTEIPSVRVYDLRHRFASANLNRWLDNGDNIASKLSYLRAYMGHNSLSETAYYIHLLPENLLKSSGIDWKAFEEMIPEVSLWEES